MAVELSTQLFAYCCSVTASVAKMDVLRVAKACVPLMLILFGLTILMILCPAVVTAIPQLLL